MFSKLVDQQFVQAFGLPQVELSVTMAEAALGSPLWIAGKFHEHPSPPLVPGTAGVDLAHDRRRRRSLKNGAEAGRRRDARR